jgi:glycosyltransferase involved in cell wall biosynthesis
MRVGVDATSWANRRGFGRFARNVVSRLIELDADDRYVMYFDAGAADMPELPAGAEQRSVLLRRDPIRAAAAGSRRPVSDLLRLARAVRRRDVDVFLFPSVYTYFPVVRVPTVVGVHDATADQLPGLTFPSRRDHVAWNLKQRVAVSRAKRVFSVSGPARADIVARFGLRPEQVAIVPEAPDPVFSPRSAAQVAGALEWLGLPKSEPFLLYAGGISPHKNLDALLAAYVSLGRSGRRQNRLLVAGDLSADSYLSSADALRRTIAERRLEDDVRLLGYVTDETLACLYSGATAVVSPSLAEGFGLTAVEAAACGAATVLSDLPAHHAALGNAALYFPPTDSDAMSRQLAKVIEDGHLRAELGERGQHAAAAMSWTDAARKLRAVLGEAAGRRR